jgi:pyruvate,water dikinase
MTPLVVRFSEVAKSDIALVGGKGANLGEMLRAGIPVPDGFIVTSQSWYYFIDSTGLRDEIRSELTNLNRHDSKQLQETSERIKNKILSKEVPSEIAQKIIELYHELTQGKKSRVAIRSSATAEDLPDASFAGQQATFLNVEGDDNVVETVKKCWASLFEARAIFYREEQHFDHFKVGIAVPVQQMIQSESSGIMFSIDPVTNDTNTIIIESIYGLGEYIVGGVVNPDHYEVDKNSLEIKSKKIAKQTHKMTLSIEGTNADVPVGQQWQEQQKIADEHIRTLAQLSIKLEQHYGKPQDSEWAYQNGKVYIVQTRPITTINAVQTAHAKELSSQIQEILKSSPLVKGAPASPGVASGNVVIIHSPQEIDKVRTGDILVTEMTTPDFVPAMKRAAAIVTDLGGRTCHAAIVSRELGTPCVVGCDVATTTLKQGQLITVDGTNGYVYDGGEVGFIEKAGESDEEVANLQTRTKLYVNLAEPELAYEVSRRYVDGLGLLRAEFMIAGIGVHPKKLLKDGKGDIFVEKLSDQLRIFAHAFNPRQIIYRFTDFKTNEYRALEGGAEFEPEEPNPMLGFRGCYRYIHDPDVFKLEIDAIKRVREDFGYKNLHVMIPFVRTIQELIQVKKLMSDFELRRSKDFKLYMMVEIPSNVILLDEFLDVGVDGVSIGSNDLTMLILGTDRDNSEVASEFDERNEAVMLALEHIVKTCKQRHVECGICGQAPSVYPEITEKLVEWGATSISVSPDMINHTRKVIYEIEQINSRS